MHQQTTWRADSASAAALRQSAASSSGPTVHLVKLLSRAGVASRRDALRLVQSGRVLVDGAALTAPGASYLIPQTARVTIDGKPFLDPLAAAAQAAEQATKRMGEAEVAVSATMDDAGSLAASAPEQRSSSAPAAIPLTPVRVPTRLPRPRVWLYYKPVGLLCSHKDEVRQRRTMFQQIHEDYFAAHDALRSNEAAASMSAAASTMQDETIDRLLSVGRLDYLSEGLMILTNSGAIQGFLEHPTTAFERTYRIKIPEALTEEQERALQSGLNIEGFQYKPVQLVRLTAASATPSKRSTGVWYELQLREGKNRELRNLLNHFGHPILKLIRVGFHNWKVDVNFMRQAAAEAAEAAKLSPTSPRAKAASMPLAARPPVEIVQRLTDGSGRKKDTVVSLVPGQLVEIEWPSHLEQQRKAWLARQTEARAHAAAVAALAPSSSVSSSSSTQSSFSRSMHSGSGLSSPLGSPPSWSALSASQHLQQSVAGPFRSFSSQHTPFSTTNPASAFLSRKKGQHEGHDPVTAAATNSASSSSTAAGSAPAAASSAAATPVTEEIPTHIHSMTCGCANENTIPNDDQRILPDEFEGGSEAFLAGLDQSISGQRHRKADRYKANAIQGKVIA